MNRIKLFLSGILVVAVFISCVSPGGSIPTTMMSKSGMSDTPDKKEMPVNPVLSPTPVYYASGTGSTQSGALNNAKLNVVKKASADALGIASAAANRDKLESKIYIASTANAYVYNNTMEILDKGSSDGNSSVTIGIKVNLEALSNVLRANEIYGNIILPQGGDVLLADMERPSFAPEPVAVADKPAAPKPAVPAPAAPGAVAATPEEKALIDEIIGNMTFMVYYDEDSGTDPFLAKTAVAVANRYLSENGMEYVDLDQIEQIKKDQALAYEDETGKSVSIIQWIAGKLNADIYIEIVVDANSSTKGRKYYGSASVSLKNFDASTAVGRGSSYYQTVPPALSTVSEADALNNAVASATYNAIG
ncbi:MAG: hypothetical protein L3J12_10120, partial [Spirochaetales bacterium]|nr:hypothetical protein [Spirochaetales bacterium]